MNAVYHPHEHGLWAWVAVPQLAAVAMQPGVSSVSGFVAVMIGFLASNAHRRGSPRHALAAAAVAAVPAAVHFATAVHPMVSGIAFATLAVVALILPKRVPRHALAEVPGILALSGLGGAVAVAAGEAPTRAVLVSLVIATWHTYGLWWVRSALAPFLAGREPWAGGIPVCVALTAVTAGVAVATGHPFVALVPLLYPLRVVMHRRPSRAADARRVGIAELGWALGATLVATLA